MATKSKSQRIRELLAAGLNATQIAAKLKCSRQLVYAVRYNLNKQQGLGALPVQPARRGRPPKVKETGIAPTPVMQDEARVLSEQAEAVSRQAEIIAAGMGVPPTLNPAVNAYMQAYPTGERGALYNTMATPRSGIREFTPPKRGLWERVKDFFRG